MDDDERLRATTGDLCRATAYVIEDERERRDAQLQICRGYDVPPWVVFDYPKPRLARLRWALRRWWEFR
jgi:hypothetical protein